MAPENSGVAREPYRRLLARLASGIEAQTGEPFSLYRDPRHADHVINMFKVYDVEALASDDAESRD